MIDFSSHVEKNGIGRVDRGIKRRDFRLLNPYFPSYFRNSRNFPGGLAPANRISPTQLPEQPVPDFRSIAAHVAIV
jgi:hypothetical protein